MLRNEAQAVASQVVSFRSWVAGSGMVWVDNLSKDFHDFLAKRPDSNGNFYFGKNPALATRELSDLANKSTIRATFRVTSNEYRQAANAPDEFETSAMNDLQANKDRKYIEGFEAGSYRYVQPIYVKKNCLKCHGDPADAPVEVIEKYGSDKAFGYKEGDVRGVISVKLPDLKIMDIAPALVNPFTIGLILLALAINLLFTQYGLIKRLRSLTQSVKTIADGELETELKYAEPGKSKDEVDHVAYAIDMLRNSLRVAMRHLNS